MSHPITPTPDVKPVATCKASYYGEKFRGRPTASGEVFNPDLHTAAHKTLDLGSELVVRYKHKEVRVVVNDRGPHVKGRCLDLSKAAFRALAPLERGIIEVDILAPAS